MRNQKQNRTLGRPASERIALLRSLSISLIEHGKIQTTEAKAKELRPYIERLVTKGKVDSVSSRRLVATALGEPKQDVIKKLFTEIGKKYADRNGGYTRVIKLGDTLAGRREAVIEFV